MGEVRCGSCENPCIFYDLIKDRPELKDLITQVRYEKGDLLFQEGTPIFGCYVICKGKAKLVKRALSGKKQLFKLCGPGEILGKADLFSKDTHSSYARTLEESWIGLIEKGNFLKLVGEHLPTVLKIAKELSEEINVLRERLMETAYGSVRERIIHLLLSLEERHSRDKENALPTVDLTQTELAEMAGVARETVSRYLCKLKEEGLISFEGHRIVILDEKRLGDLI